MANETNEAIKVHIEGKTWPHKDYIKEIANADNSGDRLFKWNASEKVWEATIGDNQFSGLADMIQEETGGEIKLVTSIDG